MQNDVDGLILTEQVSIEKDRQDRENQSLVHKDEASKRKSSRLSWIFLESAYLGRIPYYPLTRSTVSFASIL